MSGVCGWKRCSGKPGHDGEWSSKEVDLSLQREPRAMNQC